MGGGRGFWRKLRWALEGFYSLPFSLLFYGNVERLSEYEISKGDTIESIPK